MYPLECIHFAKREMNITANNWASNVKKLLDRVVPKCPTFDRAGFPDVWMFPNSVNPDRFLPLLKIMLKDMYIAEWREGVLLSQSLMLYREIKIIFEILEYLLLIKTHEKTDVFCLKYTSPPTKQQ